MQSTGCVACGRPRHSDLLLQCGKLPVLRIACAEMGQQGQLWCASSAQRFERSRQDAPGQPAFASAPPASTAPGFFGNVSSFKVLTDLRSARWRRHKGERARRRACFLHYWAPKASTSCMT